MIGDEGLPALTESKRKKEEIPKNKIKNYPQREIQL